MTTFSLGLTPETPCSYLPHQQQQLMVTLPDKNLTSSDYNLLVENGFRRNGDVFYRPNCQNCNACQSLRVDAMHFIAAKRHKRLLNKTSHLIWVWKSALDPNWFPLYEKYIAQRHANGSMYPANAAEFLKFCGSKSVKLHYLHAYDKGKLIAIAVTDEYESGYSAFYTFFDPDSAFSLGTRCILEQIKTAQKNHKHWVYLGFQVDECPAMRYKQDYQPHQRFKNSQWHSSS